MQRFDINAYELQYYKVTGPVLSFRYMFHYADINFEDTKLDFGSWSKYVFQLVMPEATLNINNKSYKDSKSIGRFLAMRCKLYGVNIYEALDVETAVNSITDIEKTFKFSWGSGITELCEDRTTLLECLNKFEKQVKDNKGYFVHGKLSWADILYAAYTKIIFVSTANDINMGYPELKKLVDKVHQLPRINAFLRQSNLSLI